MQESVAYLETASGRKYLAQLCKHFAHKIAVTYTESRGDCRFPRGEAIFEADESGLSMAVSAADAEGLAQTQAIIESHLLRFAFREKLEGLDWRQARAA